MSAYTRQLLALRCESLPGLPMRTALTGLQVSDALLNLYVPDAGLLVDIRKFSPESVRERMLTITPRSYSE